MAAGPFEPGSFFDALPAEGRGRLLSRGDRRRLRAGATLFVEGDESHRVFLLLRGRAKIFSTDQSGRESVLAIRGPGDLLGELSAVDGGARSASAAALEPVELLSIPGAEFRASLTEDAGLAHALLTVVVARLRDSDRKRAEFGGADATRRVARRILELASRYGDPQADGTVAVTLPLSQEDLAAWTGSSREAVSRAVGDLRRAGLVETGRRTVSVLDAAGLRRRSI